MIDNTDTLIRFYKKAKKESKYKADSLKKEFKMQASDDIKEKKRIYNEYLEAQTKKEEDAWFHKLYLNFRKAKRTQRKKGLIKFFTSAYFQISLKYSIWSEPYGLPHVETDSLKENKSSAKQDKHHVGKKSKKDKKEKKSKEPDLKPIKNKKPSPLEILKKKTDEEKLEKERKKQEEEKKKLEEKRKKDEENGEEIEEDE